jgi:hypothetical protein
MENFEELFSGHNEVEESEFNDRMLRAACENTYLILTGKGTYEAMLEKESMQKGSIDQYVETAILFNPLTDEYNPKFPHLRNEVSKVELIDFLVEYYIESEEYEKCSELVKIKNK